MTALWNTLTDYWLTCYNNIMNNNLKNQIGAGVNFEENVINVIVSEITKAEEFQGLSEEKRKRIVEMLTILVRDSERHKKLLSELALKY